jgi:hypothetical protein
MRTKFFNSLAAGLTAFGLVTIAPSLAFAQTIPSNESEVEHLICVKDTQGLMCKTDDRDNALTKQNESVPQQLASTAPQILSSEQLGQFSNVLLGWGASQSCKSHVENCPLR